VAGVDDELRENLESFAALDYPDYELLFGVASPTDEAIPVLRSFLSAHPGLDARIVITTPPRGAVQNPKVAQLIDLTKEAKGAVLVVSDANVRVPRSYLANLVEALMRPGVGLVSSVIRGGGERTLGAAIENAQLGGFVAPGVTAAHFLLGRPITVGKSMALRRADLERVGGWESVGGVLAEDDVLGQRFFAAGYEVTLCLDPIENRNVHTTVQKTLERHGRWALMRRAITPLGFACEPFLSPIVIATLVATICPSALAFELWLLALLLQFTGALLSLTLLGAPRALALALLEPIRSMAFFACWLMGCLRRRVSWRGNAFYVGAGSALTPVTRQGAARAREAA